MPVATPKGEGLGDPNGDWSTAVEEVLQARTMSATGADKLASESHRPCSGLGFQFWVEVGSGKIEDVAHEVKLEEQNDHEHNFQVQKFQGHNFQG
ncbi:hypothetical protein V6N11_082864 [Hibiscus sabdariffa]|uniref:Uncharacterized protein n=1 Tax=Hibiscus sabdariffa TaxID=183260 RepID=A0ABR2QKQ5_9ROSI